MYSPLGLVIFVAVEGTCTFYKRSRSLFVAAFYAKTNVTSRAWKATLNRNALAIGCRHAASLLISAAIRYNVS